MDNSGDARASEERYRGIINAVYDGIWTIDATGKTTFANPGMARLLHTTVEEMMGKPSFDHVFEEDIEEAQALFQKKFDGDREPFEFRLRRSDGSQFWALVCGLPVHDSSGNAIELLGTFHDITDRKLAEQLSARHARELADFNAELQQFALVVSHDLREPIRTMRTYAEVLQRFYADKLDSKAQECLGFIISGADRMDQLVKDLQSYSGVSAREDIGEPVDLKAALESARKNLDIAIREAGVEIECSELPVVFGNEWQLVDLFQNLLSNAIKYQRPDQSPRVQISAVLNRDEWIVSVHDNGIGIAKEYHDKIFGVLTRLHGREIPGTGMGLAICNKIVQNHGGRLWVESEPGHGSTFLFSLLARQPVQAQSTASLTKGAGSSGYLTPPRETERVL